MVMDRHQGAPVQADLGEQRVLAPGQGLEAYAIEHLTESSRVVLGEHIDLLVRVL